MCRLMLRENCTALKDCTCIFAFQFCWKMLIYPHFFQGLGGTLVSKNGVESVAGYYGTFPIHPISLFGMFLFFFENTFPDKNAQN